MVVIFCNSIIYFVVFFSQRSLAAGINVGKKLRKSQVGGFQPQIQNATGLLQHFPWIKPTPSNIVAGFKTKKIFPYDKRNFQMTFVRHET